MKNILNFFLLVASLIASLICFEILCRFFWDYNTGNLLNQPGTETVQKSFEFSTKIQINANGLRDQKYPFDKEDNVFRIIVIGDSMTFGWGVEAHDTYPKVLERMLNETAKDIEFEVINISKFGSGPLHFSQFLEYIGLKYQPDLVVVTFFPGNDLSDDLNTSFKSGLSNRIISFLKRNFYSSFFILSRAQRLRTVFQDMNKIKAPTVPFNKKHLQQLADQANVPLDIIEKRLEDVDQRIITNAVISYKNGNRYFFFLLEVFLQNPSVLKEEYDLSSPKWQSGWERNRYAYKKINYLCSKNSAEMMIITVPASFQINKYYLSEIRKYGVELDDTVLEESNAQKEMHRFCSKEGIQLLDLQSAFKKDTGHQFYYVADGHWNREGHLLAAQVVYNKLKINGIIKMQSDN